MDVLERGCIVYLIDDPGDIAFPSYRVRLAATHSIDACQRANILPTPYNKSVKLIKQAPSA